jgi:Fe-S-cluster containining protein
MVEVRYERITNFCNENGECSKCGSCCSNFLPLRKDEIKEIKRIVKKKHIKQNYHYAMGEYTLDATCPFLNDKHRCVIYENRPIICEIFKCNKNSMNEEEFNELKQKGLIPEKVGIVNMRDEFFPKKKK